MNAAHIDVLQELATSHELPFDLRLEAGKLLGMLVDYKIKTREREVPVPHYRSIPPRTTRDIRSHPHLPPLD